MPVVPPLLELLLDDELELLLEEDELELLLELLDELLELELEDEEDEDEDEDVVAA
ncbi:hypothetical protein GCM10027046_28730 [Uliginosibacterium flavum]